MRRGRRLGKAHRSLQSDSGVPHVIGIYAIGIFILVMAALNIFEFGRLD